MLPPTVRPDPLVIWDLALGMAVLAFSAGVSLRPLRWVFRILAGVLLWAGDAAAFAP